MKKFIAYQGEIFTIEWYFNDNEKSEALNYYEELPKNRKEKLFYLIYLLADTGKIRNEKKFRHEGDQIYAFKPSSDRFLCFFFKGLKIIITNAYTKKTNKLPPREKQKALNLKEDYIKRLKDGKYYE